MSLILTAAYRYVGVYPASTLYPAASMYPSAGIALTRASS